MILFQQITHFVDQHTLLPNGSSVIVGLSGGPDSVFLLHYLRNVQKTKQLTITAVHIDHQWHEQSTDIRNWCQKLCADLSIPFIATTLAQIEYEPSYRGSDEDYARHKRRFFFTHIAQKINAQKIALAHHRQDQQETFFIRLMRGSSLTGLTSIQPQDEAYIHPLLDINKHDIVDYLTDQKINYCSDSTNNSLTHLRNRIRHVALPALRACDTRIDQTFFATLQRLQDTETFLQKMAQDNFVRICQSDQALHTIDYHALFQCDRVLVYRMLILWFKAAAVPFEPSQSLMDEVIRFLHHARQPRHRINPHWSITKTNTRKLACIEKE